MGVCCKTCNLRIESSNRKLNVLKTAKIDKLLENFKVLYFTRKWSKSIKFVKDKRNILLIDFFDFRLELKNINGISKTASN